MLLVLPFLSETHTLALLVLELIFSQLLDIVAPPFANGEIRADRNTLSNKVDLSLKDYNGLRSNAQRIIDILTTD